MNLLRFIAALVGGLAAYLVGYLLLWGNAGIWNPAHLAMVAGLFALGIGCFYIASARDRWRFWASVPAAVGLATLALLQFLAVRSSARSSGRLAPSDPELASLLAQSAETLSESLIATVLGALPAVVAAIIFYSRSKRHLESGSATTTDAPQAPSKREQ